MFVHAVPDNRGNRDGYYCSLVESYRQGGRPSHKTILSFGFITSGRLPYLKAAFNKGNPADILEKAICSQEEYNARKRQAESR
jgi:hypothetical protein